MSIESNDPFAQSYEIALCQHIKHGWITVWLLRDGRIPSDYVQLSAMHTIVFDKVTGSDHIQQALKAIDDLEREARNELNKTLSELADRRACLLSLTYQSEAK